MTVPYSRTPSGHTMRAAPLGGADTSTTGAAPQAASETRSSSTMIAVPRRLADRRLIWRAAAAALALVLLTAACSAISSDDADAAGGSERATFTTVSASDQEEDFAADTNDGAMGGDMDEMFMSDDEMMDDGDMDEEEMLESAPASDEGDTAALATSVPDVAANLGRDIIYTARIAVETADVATAGAQATSIIEDLGGFVFAQDTRTQGRARTTLTFKVRPQQFSAALERLSNVGELVEQTVNAEDVTGIVVDLASRISTAEVSVNRLREFLSQATEVEGVAELERELASRESDLERLRGQLRSLRDRVDLATITLSITESVEAVPSASMIVQAWIAAGDEDPCLGYKDVLTPPDGDVGLCIEVENNGETVLTDIALTSNALRFDNDDLTVPDGTSLARIEPGERATATLDYTISDGRIAGRVATRGLDIDIRVSAAPVTADSAELGRLARGAMLQLYLEADETSPGFGDALSGGWGALVAIATGIGLVVAALLPFLPVIAIVLAVTWWWLRRRGRRASSR